MKYFYFTLLFILLTVLTQVGGLALIVGLLIAKRLDFKFNKTVAISGTYLLFTFLIVPVIAPFFGREKVKNTNSIKPTNYLTVLMNRNYVKPEINSLLNTVAKQLPAGIEVQYLDANFPFINKFPLLPHLSHNDGKKIDLSFIYENDKGEMSNEKPSRSGYGVFVEPQKNEYNQTEVCLSKAYWQYDYPKYLSFGNSNESLIFSKKGTIQLLSAILSSSTVSKVFIEQHLKTRLQLSDSRLRFQGCRAVRHDDHIHLQIK